MERITLKTPCGSLAGLDREDHWAFFGVPYAQPPLGKLRWHAPVPLLRWEGELQATAFPPMGPQPDVRGMPLYGKEFYDEDVYFPGQSEDCLYLSVWCPPVQADSALPVAVWLHGGGFDHGYSYEKEFDGRAYAQRGVILVSVAYRLGALGFLASRERMAQDGFAGNYGHLDQLEALRWIKRNIAAFGGDPENITLMGQSAGAFSVQNLLSMEETPTLLHKAILQSGCGRPKELDPTQSLETGYDRAERLMALLDCATMEQLEQRSAQDILAATQQLAQTVTGLPFAPVADGRTLMPAPAGTFLPPRDPAIRCLTGATKDDISPNGDKTVLFRGAKDFAVATGPERVYVYHFVHDLPGSGDGSFHSSELWYTFGTLHRCWRPMGMEDVQLSETMVGYWTNFMKTGDPNGPGLPRWESYASGQIMQF